MHLHTFRMTLPGIGVFGTGSIVRIIIPFLREKGFRIEAIWGRTLAEVSKVASDLEIPFHTSRIDDVLLRKDVDLIFIMCSPSLHSQIAVKALGIGKHVVCDKPAGLSQSEALKMVRAAQYYPSLISIVNHSLRFLPAFVHMKKALEDGYLAGPVTVIEVRVHMGSLLHNGKYKKNTNFYILIFVDYRVFNIMQILSKRGEIKNGKFQN